MRGFRAHSAGAVATLVLFAAALIAPRPGVVSHHHVGGERAHVHGDVPLPRTHTHGTGHHHHDGTGGHHHHHHDADAHTVHHDAPATGARALVLEIPSGRAGGHWHVQNPYHRAVTTHVPGILATWFTALLPPAPARTAPHRATAPGRARSPPLPLAA